MYGYCRMMLILQMLQLGITSMSQNPSNKEKIFVGIEQIRGFECPWQCMCNATTLTVSCSKANLTSLPNGLSNMTKQLDLSENGFTQLVDGMFKPTPLLVNITFRNNNISHIGKTAFFYLSDLTHLDISDNPLGGSEAVSNLLWGLGNSTLKLTHLALSNSSITTSDQNAFQHSQLQSLILLDMSKNPDIGYLQDDIFSSMRSLKSLTLEASKLLHLNPCAFQGLNSLIYLSLLNNSIDTFPNFLNGTILPSLITLELSYNHLKSIEPECLKFQQLRKLSVRHNLLTKLVENNFAYLPKLQTLILEHNQISFIDPLAFRSASLLYINLFDNKIQLDGRHIDVFKQAQSLQKLILSNNRIMTKHFFAYGFQNLTNLEYLGINSLYTSGLDSLPTDAFLGLDKLNTLQYGDAGIYRLNRDAFRDLTSLKRLFLFSNHLSVISYTSLPQNLWNRLEMIDLRNNPFHCDCRLLWFMFWLNITKAKIVSYGKGGNYKCNSPREKEGLTLHNFHPTPDKCLTVPLSLPIRMSMMGSALVIFLITIFSAMYRWRWRIRYTFFLLGSWWRSSQKLHQNQGEKTYCYDAFIGYNNQDSEWVNRTLLGELEQRSEPPFRLCLYERDWLPGCSIINCIGESIQKSRRTILIVTNCFAQSQWCQLELTMAQHKLFDDDKDNLILAIMEDIDPMNMTPRLALEMKRRTYLTWTEDVHGQQLFWEKLKKSLKQPLPGVKNHVPPIQEFCDLTG